MELDNSTYNKLVDEIRQLVSRARHQIAYNINIELLYTYWNIGRLIVSKEQEKQYNESSIRQLLISLSKDLTIELGKGFSRSQLTYMRLFYLYFQTFPEKIMIGLTVSHLLSWSHYHELLNERALKAPFNLAHGNAMGRERARHICALKGQHILSTPLPPASGGYVGNIALSGRRFTFGHLFNPRRCHWAIIFMAFSHNPSALSFCLLFEYFNGNLPTPQALNMNNPMQAAGAARGRENRRQNPPSNPRQRGIWNSVGVQPLPASCCAPTEHRVSALHRLTPSCGYRLARGYYLFHAYGVAPKFEQKHIVFQ